MKKIFLLFILILFTFPISCYATENYPIFTDEESQQIINFLKSDERYSYGENSVSNTTALNIINNIQVSDLTLKLNQAMQSMYNNMTSYPFTKENVSIAGFKGQAGGSGTSSGGNYYSICIIASRNNTNTNHGQLKFTTNKYSSYLNKYFDGFGKYDNISGSVLYTSIYYNEQGSGSFYTGSYLSTNDARPQYTTLINPNINNGKIDIPYLMSFSENAVIYYNGNQYINQNIVEQEQTYIEQETISENGFRIFSGEPLVLNLYDNNKLLNTFFYIGDNLSYKNEYYYYDNNNNKIYQKHGFIEEIKSRWPQSGDSFGFLIQPKSMWVRYSDYYNKDIYEDLTIYFYSGDVLLEEIKPIDNLKVISWVNSNSNNYTGNIYDESGDVIGSFSGDIDNNDLIMNGFNRVNDTIENTILGEVDNETGERKGGLLGGILDGIKGLFIPPDDYFFNDDIDNLGLWQRLNNFFSAKLGFLWDAIVFIPNLVKTITDLLTSMGVEWSIVVPDLYVPDFQGGSVCILQSFEWSPYTTIYQNEDIADLYDLYLDIIDFFVYWGLVFYAVQTYNEVLGNSNTEIE